MSLQEIVIVAGLAFAACGHVLLHEVGGACAVWNWLDGHFPPSWRSAPRLAGTLLLALGTVGVLAPVLG